MLRFPCPYWKEYQYWDRRDRLAYYPYWHVSYLWPLLDQPVILGLSQDRSCSPKWHTGDPGSRQGRSLYFPGITQSPKPTFLITLFACKPNDIWHSCGSRINASWTASWMRLSSHMNYFATCWTLQIHSTHISHNTSRIVWTSAECSQKGRWNIDEPRNKGSVPKISVAYCRSHQCHKLVLSRNTLLLMY